MANTLAFPDLAYKAGEPRPTIEISIDFIPEKYRMQWHDIVREFTADWITRNSFQKKATLWNWCCISINLIHKHPDNPVPSLSEYIMQFGFPDRFFIALEERLRFKFNDQVRFSEYIPFCQDDGWRAICHVERRRAWENSSTDSPDDWKPVSLISRKRKTPARRKKPSDKRRRK
jgi:hypothetical protein